MFVSELMLCVDREGTIAADSDDCILPSTPSDIPMIVYPMLYSFGSDSMSLAVGCKEVRASRLAP